MNVALCAACTMLLSNNPVHGQETYEPLRTETPPVIDGVLDDPVWDDAPSLTGFKTWRPDYNADMAGATVVKVAYDGKNLYFAFRCYDSAPDRIKTSITSRDNIARDDWVAVNLDSFNDQQGLYVLYVNPAGIQGDTRYAGGHEDHDFDMVWYSAGRIDNEGYTVEIRLPLESIRFAGTNPTYMGVIFERSIVQSREAGTYPPLDPAQGESWLTQTMPMVFRDLERPKVLEVLPAVTYTYAQAHSRGTFATVEDEPNISLTAKYGLTSELVLDGTFNPDFSQVEADAGQVDVNLRYDLYFAEKRPFFLEGRAHYAMGAFGASERDPLLSIVHTRTIVEPIAGARLSGKLGERDIVAAMFAVDELPSTSPVGNREYANVPILRYKRVLSEDGYLGGIYAARQFGQHLNFATGVDGLMRMSGSSTLGYHGLLSYTRQDAFTDDVGGHAIGANYARSTRDIDYSVVFKDISEDFRAETGYITRTGVTQISGLLRPKFYPGVDFIQRIDGELFTAQTRDRFYDMWETFNHISFEHFFLNRLNFKVKYSYSSEIFLGDRFQTGGFHVAFGGRVTNQLSFGTLYRRTGAVYYGAEPYQGRSNRVTTSMTIQPSGKLEGVASFIFFDFRGDENSTNDYNYPLVRGKLTYQLSRYLFFRGILEYNDYRSELLTDLLASFTYIPGTVIHVGYGSLHDKTRWDPSADRYVEDNRLLQTRRQLFLKGSYLWRM